MLKRSHSNVAINPEEFYLDLSHRGLNSRDISDIWENHSAFDFFKVTSLQMSFNNIRDEGAQIVSLYLKSSVCLTSLDISFNNIGNGGLKGLCEGIKTSRTLHTLLLSGNSITSLGFSYLKEALVVNSTLTTLYLSGNSGHSDGFQYIAEALHSNKTLRVLSLSGNKGEKTGAAAIAKSLVVSKQIRSLNLSDNRIGDEGIVPLSESLHQHKALKVLELSFNMISHNSMESLSYALWNYTSLNVLLLDNNKIGDLGAKLLASCVSSMNLVHLNVAFNDIGSEGVAALLHACLLPVKSSCMSILNISGSTINTDVARLLADLICKNSTLNELSLDRANISSTGERYIAGGIASNRHSALVSFTGFDLGEVLTSLGSPPILAGMSNKKALAHLADMWRAHDSKEVHEVRDVSAVSSSTSVDEEYTLSAKDSGITAATLLSAKDVGAHIATSQGQHEMKQVEETQAGLQMYGSTAVSLLSISNELLAIDGPPSSSSTSSGGGPHLKAVEHVAPSFHKYLHALHEISYLPFIAADLWSLHQFYFSPSPIIEHGENTSPDDSDSDSAASPAPRRGSLTVERPKKRQSNVRTMARIAGYPRLKNLLERVKSDESEWRMLTILRQLKFLEDNAEDLNAFDLESALIESL